MPPSSEVDPVRVFIASMTQALCKDEEQGLKPPLERRKLRTILADCGKRGSARVLAEIDSRFTMAGIHTEPRLVDSGLRLDDWVWFSTGRFPPDSAFSQERPIFSALFRRALEEAHFGTWSSASSRDTRQAASSDYRTAAGSICCAKNAANPVPVPL